MKKVYKFLFALAFIPALASCSGDQNVDVNEAKKIVGGEGDYASYKHDSSKVLEKYSEVKVTAETEYPKGKAKADIDAMEDGDAKSFLNQQYEKTYESSFARNERVLYAPLEVLAAASDDYVPVDAINALALVNAGLVLNDYSSLLEDNTYKQYPHSDSIIYNFKSKELHINYSVCYESSEVEWTYVDANDKTTKTNYQLTGFALNVDAKYGECGEVKELSYVVTSAHDGDDTNGNDKMESYDYYINRTFHFEYKAK